MTRGHFLSNCLSIKLRFLKGPFRTNRLSSTLFVLGCILVGLPLNAWAANLPFGQVQTDTISSAAQTNSYTFSANAGDIVDLTTVTTSGNLSPTIRLYNPDGTQLSSATCCGSTIEMVTNKLPATGTYTVLVADYNRTNTGNYVIYAQRTNNPAGAVALLFGGQPQTGTISSAAQSNSYIFSGSASDVIDLTTVTTSGNLSPTIRLYNPDGTQLSSATCCGSTIEMNNAKLPATGTYTVFVVDYYHTNTGNYKLSSLCFGVCTSTSPPPPPPPTCQIGLTPSRAAVGVNGGANSLNIGLSTSTCAWTATSNASWVTFPGASSGTGNGALNFSVASNASSGLSRVGTVTVSTTGSQATFTVTESGAACTFALTQASQAFSSTGGAGTANVVAAGGCTWTASAASAPFVTITSGSSGSGDGPVNFTVAANPSSTARTGTLTIAGQSYTVTQAGTAVTTACTASVPTIPTVALEGRTEVLGALLLSCTGLTGALTSDILLTLNTNVSNALLSASATDAILTVNGANPLNGQISGYNSLRWLGVTLIPASGNASLRITGVRADASLLGSPASLQASAITGLVSFNGQTPVPVTGSQQTMANAAVSLNFVKQQASPATGGAQTTIPLVYQEARPTAFQAGTAATRLRMVLSNVPGTVQVYAPVFPMEGATHAQLFSADATGFGGSAMTGTLMAGTAYQQLTVTGGVATATWVVLSADPAVAESFTFPLLVMNAATSDLNAIQVAASLGPVSAVSVASASVGVPYSVLLANPLSGGGPYTWSVTAGALPNGLTLNPSTGAVSGTPTSPGTFSFTVYVTNNSVSFPQSTTQSFTIAVAPLPRYRDFSAPQNLVNLRITTTSQGTGSCSLTSGHSSQGSLTAKAASATAASPHAVVVNSNVTFTNQLVNDTSDPAQTATNVIIRDNLPSGLTLTGCAATGGASCSSSGNQVMVNYGTLAPGQCVNVTVVAQVGPVPNGTVLENPVSAAGDQVNADLSASTASSSIVVTAPVGPPASVAPSGGTPQSTAVGTAFPTALQVSVSDSNGNPVGGVTVNFTAPATGASAVLSSATAVTNASGVASVMAMANSTAGSYVVTASVAGLAAPASFSLTNNPAGGVTNLALGKSATQSSTLAGYASAAASSAIDGNTDGLFFDNSVTATLADVNAWWQVDLGSSATLNSIAIWNRTDCCGSRLNDYWVFVSNTPFLATDTPTTLQLRAGTFSSHQTTAPSPSATIALPGGTQGRYVRVQLTGTNNLSLAEVQVFGPMNTVLVDLAQGQPASQSSTLAGTPSAGAAADGNTDGSFADGSVTATNADTNAWWQVDLGASATIASVVVWNRTDCCGSRLGDYWVFVSNTPFNATDTPASLQNRAGTFASHQTTAPNPSASIIVGGAGRYVRVQLTGANYLSLAEVQVLGAAAASSNVAMGKSATQSSTLPGTPSAGAAVDGNTDGAFGDGSVTATNLDTNAWWQVDLGASTTVNSVAVWNRTDCCGSRLNDYWVFVSNTPFLATDTPATLQGRAGTFSSHQTNAPSPSTSIAVGAQGRYVRVQLTGANYLSLAEVQVFGIPPAASDVAVGQAATESSTLAGTPSAGVAVDGNTDGVFGHGSVTATNLDTNAWWQVDLGGSFNVSSVVVWNRTDCCGSRLNDYWVFVSNTPFLATDTPATLQNRAGTFGSHQTAAPNPSTSISVSAPGRYVRVQLTGANYLSLAEVQVIGQ